MKTNSWRRKLVTIALALTLTTGGVAAGTLATAEPAAALYGPIVNVTMGPYSSRWTCYAMYGLSVGGGDISSPCYQSGGKWYFIVYRFNHSR